MLSGYIIIMPYKDPEKARKYALEYYHANRDRILERRRKQYRENPAKERARHAKWMNENRDSYNERRNKKRHENMEEFRKLNREYYKIRKSKPGYKEKMKVNQRTWRIRKKIELINTLGGGCKICGYDRCLSALELHHRDPNKKKNKAWDFLHSSFSPEDFIVLCSNCHKELHNPYFIRDEEFDWKNDNVWG